MSKNKLIQIACLALSLALWSCAAPKAVVVEEAPVTKKETAQETSVEAPVPSVGSPADDGIRLPDMLGLPSENEFRSTRPATTPGGGSGAVIARPPTSPPAEP